MKGDILFKSVDREMWRYGRNFTGKRIFIDDCDFEDKCGMFEWFIVNFNKLKLKELIMTSPFIGGEECTDEDGWVSCRRLSIKTVPKKLNRSFTYKTLLRYKNNTMEEKRFKKFYKLLKTDDKFFYKNLYAADVIFFMKPSNSARVMRSNMFFLINHKEKDCFFFLTNLSLGMPTLRWFMEKRNATFGGSLKEICRKDVRTNKRHYGCFFVTTLDSRRYILPSYKIVGREGWVETNKGNLYPLGSKLSFYPPEKGVRFWVSSECLITRDMRPFNIIRSSKDEGYKKKVDEETYVKDGVEHIMRKLSFDVVPILVEWKDEYIEKYKKILSVRDAVEEMGKIEENINAALNGKKDALKKLGVDDDLLNI